MICVEGWVRLPPGALEQFVQAAEAMIRASRAEVRCLDCAFSRDVLDPDTLRIVERWKKDDAIAAHFQTPHMAAFQQGLAALPMQSDNVHVYAGEHRRAMIER